ncbi:four-helix bundle copper-binding protein [Paenibacillus sp. J5C2022]|uniref:four-helix bundle copper-binding protein n=1 Tax=Paenibacillus sp. J5C2022 TaxID=2977129 RepID=UPI0021CFA7C3|nr:four-helix bundle copper-binding protein [Paenibacillus sp. J5C2022]
MPYRDPQTGMPQIVGVLHHCTVTCEHMITHILMSGNLHGRSNQLKLLRDCADICAKTARFVARSSPFSKAMLMMCAHVCEACAAECMKFNDPASRHCAQTCMHCARECRAAAMAMSA